MRIRMRHTYSGNVNGNDVLVVAGAYVEGKLAEYIYVHQPEWCKVIEGPEDEKPEVTIQEGPPVDRQVLGGIEKGVRKRQGRRPKNG